MDVRARPGEPFGDIATTYFPAAVNRKKRKSEGVWSWSFFLSKEWNSVGNFWLEGGAVPAGLALMQQMNPVLT
jgi:hypothetical protein